MPSTPSTERSIKYRACGKSVSKQFEEKCRDGNQKEVTTYRLSSVLVDSPYVAVFDPTDTVEIRKTYDWMYDCLTTVKTVEGWEKLVEGHVGHVRGTKIQAARSALAEIDYSTESGVFAFSVAEGNGRISTAVTQMPKVGRKYITMDGSSELVSLDVVCAQPFLLLPLCREFHCSEAHIQSFYAAICDDLYLTLSKASGSVIGRDSAKEEVLRALYSRNGQKSLFKEVLASRYPDLENLIYSIKSAFPYNQFALLMQRLESDFMIKLVGTALRLEQIKLLTVHDCLIVKGEDVERVERLVRSVGLWYTGFEPRLKISPLAA